MDLTRRRFLATPVVLGSAVASSAWLAALAAETAPMPNLSTWEAVRAQFALDPALAHFASFFISSHPAPVRDAIEAWRRAMDRNPFHVIDGGLFEDEAHNIPLQVQATIAHYLGGRAEDVALTRSTTEGLALIYHGLQLRPGDEMLVTTHDHFSHHVSAQYAAERTGASLRKVPLYDDAKDASVDSLVANLLKGIGPKTRTVGLTWVHSSTGMRLPIREMAQALKAKHPDVLLILDGVHGIGAVDETIATIGADYVSAGTHKWMFGPRGTAIAWSTADGWARLRPLIPSFSEWESYYAWTEDRPIKGPTNASRMAPGGFHAYEHQWAVKAAFDMHEAMGKARVAQRIHALNTQLKDALAGHPKIHVHTPHAPELSAGLVAFEIAGMKPEDVVKRLGEQNIVASTSPYAVVYARLAPSLVNTPAEVDRAAAAVRSLAG
ncbi:aminotransferase class V-fold PLP-dependent enzyme [Lysobacter sp. KIS68-7]|uniref:aminotransferase class V-fold PLP-dependent enzyme n=1 Tax=Lysobacter sp. KIS68-7 TaxID=2904252 RepID=UPI001E3E4653|nr:aminotransferase class V-fold PLP-dependent enzyme [Lysobacter sp. KIS68-7]UHQ18194.1 aminotransferase class V-fold PLP-dependent enzyme [Lysobacter sp. KIS68-7]